MPCQLAVLLERAKPTQQITCLGIRRRGRCIQPCQIARLNAPLGQLQRQPCQIRLLNFRSAEARHLLVLGFRPQAIADPRFEPPGPTGALGGAGPGDPLGIQPGHATARIEARNTLKPRVNHHANTVDGDAGLGNVGSQHHLAFSGWCGVDCRALLIQVKLTMKRTNKRVLLQRWRGVEGVLEPRADAMDFGLARQEHQQAARLLGKRIQARTDDSRLDVLAGLLWLAPDCGDREHPAFTGHDWRIVQQARQPLSFQRCRH
ncbi:hypothetical protein D3C72_1188180 [compost metagenome]